MIYDVTGKISGEAFPYSDGCVLIYRAESGNVTVNFDPKISREEAARALSLLAEGLKKADSATDAENFSAETPAESASDFSAKNTPEGAVQEKVLSEGTQPAFPRSSVNPDDVAEDIVRWRDGYTAYRLDGSWWWIRWHDAANEHWGMSGPLMSAVDVKKGPFDNFDETLASMMRHRAEVFQKNSYIG